MKQILLPLAALLLGAGCVVRSIHPWLSAETRVDEPSLLGSWQDAEHEVVAFFADPSSADYAYAVTLAGAKDRGGFMANLHRIDDTFLLAVGPEERNDVGSYATLPAHLLFKAVFAGDSMRLHAVDLESFAGRAEHAAAPLLPGGSKNDGYVLTGTTADAEAFLRAQLADPGFFEEQPLYSFRKLPGSPE
jgi:hypothetical protein